MKSSVYSITLFFLLLSAVSCKHKSSDSLGEESYVDSLIEKSDLPTDDEISSLLDSAKQEKTIVPERCKGLRIYVSKTTMRLYVVNESDSVIYTCGIACGIRRGNKTEKGDYKTPEGKFHISGIFNSTDWIHHTRDGRDVKGCYGPHFLRLATGRLGGIGIHGTNAPGSIGKRASEGCIRVNSANIVTLYEQYAYNGMPVEVSAEGEPLPPFKGLLEHNTSSQSASSSADDEAKQSVDADTLKFHSAPTPHERIVETQERNRVEADTLFD